MVWFLWLVIALQVLGMLVRVSQIGKERKPTTAQQVVVYLCLDGLVLWGFLETLTVLKGGR